MEALSKSRLLRSVEQAYHLARRAVARYASKVSKRRSTLQQHIVLLCLKGRKKTTDRTLPAERIEIPRIWSAIGLTGLPPQCCVTRSPDSTWLFGGVFSISQLRFYRPIVSLGLMSLEVPGVMPRSTTRNKADDSPVETHTARGQRSERNYQRTRDEDTKTRLIDRTLTYQAEYR